MKRLPGDGKNINLSMFLVTCRPRWPSQVRREPGVLSYGISKLVALCASGVRISPSALLKLHFFPFLRQFDFHI